MTRSRTTHLTSDAAHRALSLALVAATLLAVGCTIAPPSQRPDSPGHITAETPTPKPVIPPPVQAVPILPPPVAAPPSETYTVVVNDVPVRELLFALARDAEIKARWDAEDAVWMGEEPNRWIH